MGGLNRLWQGFDNGKGNIQMSDRNGRQPDRLHLAIRVNQGVQLHLHLTRLRGVEVSLVETALDIVLHEKRQLQR